MALRVNLLGEVTITVGAASISQVVRPRQLAVAFTYLVLHRHRPVTRDELAGALWDDRPPESWETALRVVLSKLRALFDSLGLDDAIELNTSARSYRLMLPADSEVDVEEASAAVTNAETALARDHYAKAAALVSRWQQLASATLLAGEDSHWLEEQRVELAGLAQRALEAQAEAAIGQGNGPAAVVAAVKAVAAAPLRESAHQLLIRAHAASGNRADALRAYETCRLLLVDELGVDPSPQTQAVYVDVLRQDVPTQQLDRPDLQTEFPPLRTLSPTRHNLTPQRTSFVGRRGDLAEIAQHLETTRLLTLVAPGGAGKTRLAYEAAADVVDRFPGGVWAVELAPLTNPDLVPAACAAALDVHDQSGHPTLDAIVTRLEHQPTLLILDNCEHLITACAQFCDALLDRCADLQILATSREPLLVAGETIWRVRSLSVPNHEAPVETLLAAEAVALFAERARGTDPLFTLGEPDARVVADICHRLDGIPLAIELAAARTRMLTVSQIAERLDDRFRLLTAGDRTAVPRQRTLKALIDWSYDLLDDGEATVFRRLSVFPASFSVDAAEHICAGDGIDEAAVLDLLDQLVAKSLLTTEQHHERRRLRMLETIRAYAQQRLDTAETGATAARHARYFATRGHDAAVGLTGPDRDPWLREVSDDYDNLRAALSWAQEHDPALGLGLAGDLSWFWYHHGQFREGRDWLASFLDNAPTGPPGPRARALTGAARLARYDNAADQARVQAEEAVQLARLAGDPDDLGYAFYVLGLAAQAQDDHAAIAAAQASVDVFRATTNRWGLALALFYLGTFSVFLGEDDLVLPALKESREIFDELDDGWGVAGCLYYMGMMDQRAGDLPHASSLIEQSVTLFRASSDRWRLATALETLAELRVAQGEPAAALTDEVASLRRQLGIA